MIDFYKVLGCDPHEVTDDDIQDLKTHEEKKSYPPCFKLVISPDGPQSGDSEVKLSLHGLNNLSPIIIRLGKEKSGIDIIGFLYAAVHIHFVMPHHNFFPPCKIIVCMRILMRIFIFILHRFIYKECSLILHFF